MADRASEIAFTRSLAQQFGIPGAPLNLLEYMQKWHCNLQINIGTTDVECGYGRRIVQNIRVMKPFEECSRCGYHSLWNTDDTNSKCNRHTYGRRGYDTVFSYTIDAGEKKALTLEQAFDRYLEMNPREDDGASIKPLHV